MRATRQVNHSCHDLIIDDETVKEIESLYDRKRIRDQARGIRR